MGQGSFERNAWRGELSSRVEALQKLILGDDHWSGIFQQFKEGDAPFSLHLAVFVQPYLNYILEKRKTVESRFSVVRIAPFKKVNPGDAILLKLSGGPILGIGQVSHAWFYNLDSESWHEIRKNFSVALCAQDPEFWRAREHATYATLMKLDHVRGIPPLQFKKQDRRGWVVLFDSSRN